MGAAAKKEYDHFIGGNVAEIRFGKNHRRPEPGNGRTPDPRAGRGFPGRRRGGRRRQGGVRLLGRNEPDGAAGNPARDRRQDPEARPRLRASWRRLNVGKPIRESTLIDVPLAIDHFRYFAGMTRHVHGLTQVVDGNTLNFTLREPLGVVGNILPWNFPLLLIAWKLAPALAAGNTVVMKPAEQTPLSALELANDLRDLLPAGVFNVVTGYGPDVGAPLASHPDVRKVAFTGETTTGRLILQYASENIVPVTVELGGKSPHIIFPDADIERAVEGVMIGIFLNQGQVCCAGSRLFLHDDIHDRFLELLVQKVKGLKIGDPRRTIPRWARSSRGTSTRRCSRTSTSGARRVRPSCAGGRGRRPGAVLGTLRHPRRLRGVRNGMRLAQEEIFGPVLSVLRWKNYDTMIADANDMAYGLGAGLWTDNLSLAVKTAKALQAGTVWINTYNALYAGAPFGGYKKSGFGRETAFETLTTTRRRRASS